MWQLWRSRDPKNNKIWQFRTEFYPQSVFFLGWQKWMLTGSMSFWRSWPISKISVMSQIWYRQTAEGVYFPKLCSYKGFLCNLWIFFSSNPWSFFFSTVPSNSPVKGWTLSVPITDHWESLMMSWTCLSPGDVATYVAKFPRCHMPCSLSGTCSGVSTQLLVIAACRCLVSSGSSLRVLVNQGRKLSRFI
jgi:hypothetical protein